MKQLNMRVDDVFEAELAALPGGTMSGKIRRAVHLLWYLMDQAKTREIRFTKVDGAEAFMTLEELI